MKAGSGAFTLPVTFPLTTVTCDGTNKQLQIPNDDWPLVQVTVPIVLILALQFIQILFNRTLAPVLGRLGIPLAYSEPARLDDIPAEVIRMGEYFHTQEVATAAAEVMAQRLAALRVRYAGRPPVPVFIQIGSDPLYTIGNDPLLNDVLATCRGVNIFRDAAVAAPHVSEETVLQKRPAVVIVPSAQPGVRTRDAARWKTLHLPAAMAGHIYGMDPDALFRPGPRLIDATEALCRHLDASR